jgi:hypothetical protein
METRVRLLIVLAGLPRPEPQLVIYDRAGRFVARADMGYEAERFLLEYYGALHWEQRRPMIEGAMRSAISAGRSMW